MPRTTRTPGAHIRANRISGSTTHLNENAVKVLVRIFETPQAITLEELMRDTSLPKPDVMRQVRLLLTTTMIDQSDRFPRYPTLGWRVFVARTKWHAVKQVLTAHGYTSRTEAATRQGLGDYYPTGTALEGTGTQQSHGRSYPPIVPINDDLEYKEETIKAVLEWKNDKKPFRPKEYSPEAVQERLAKFEWLNEKLARIYGIPKPTLRIGTMSQESWNTAMSSGNSSYNHGAHIITLEGKFSVITFFHEFGHARGFDETDTTLWSVNLYKRTFPVLFSQLRHEGHTLRVQERGNFNG